MWLQAAKSVHIFDCKVTKNLPPDKIPQADVVSSSEILLKLTILLVIMLFFCGKTYYVMESIADALAHNAPLFET